MQKSIEVVKEPSRQQTELSRFTELASQNYLLAIDSHSERLRQRQ
jgi:hypothetical protein